MAIDDASSGLEHLLDSIAASKNRDGSVKIPGPLFMVLVNMPSTHGTWLLTQAIGLVLMDRDKEPQDPEPNQV
ncbi:hypothetical protein CROQUDRAFT_102764 [Cronartium quercuum f. sp. fusiforme G11]|uniref:Uncharacterized protein n=1 Tax=Cronartium quercuum f. sp. fusiforme G11 TaxID=708437 RepID=A0A9P6N4M7_9BASI|nr:hypothetical protein CROQUDRAFT_102764 [Cronartium quercuum f. sp. fusiforme G11]